MKELNNPPALQQSYLAKRPPIRQSAFILCRLVSKQLSSLGVDYVHCIACNTLDRLILCCDVLSVWQVREPSLHLKLHSRTFEDSCWHEENLLAGSFAAQARNFTPTNNRRATQGQERSKRQGRPCPIKGGQRLCLAGYYLAGHPYRHLIINVRSCPLRHQCRVKRPHSRIRIAFKHLPIPLTPDWP